MKDFDIPGPRDTLQTEEQALLQMEMHKGYRQPARGPALETPEAPLTAPKAGPMERTPPNLLHLAAHTLEERNAEYGDLYKRTGAVVAAAFPDGVTLRSVEDFTRYGHMFMAFCKLTRYANALPRGGHQDSARDLMVYAAFMEEATRHG